MMNLYVEQSISSSHTLTGLINDLLDHAKMEASTFQLNNEYFNMYEVLTSTFSVMSYQANDRKIKLLL